MPIRRKRATTYKKKTYPKRAVPRKRAPVRRAPVKRKRVVRRKRTVTTGLTSMQSKLLKDMLPREQTVVYDAAQQIKSTYGAPAASTSVFTISPLGQTIDLFNISDLIPQPTDSSESTIKYTLVNSKQTTTFTNQTLSKCYLDCYICFPRQDVPNTVYESSGSTTTAADYLTPLQLFNNGYAVSSSSRSSMPIAPITASFVTADYAATPFQSPDFCAWFKVARKKTYAIEGGESKQLILSMRKPHVINGATLCTPTLGDGSNNIQLNTTMLRGKAMFLICFLRGQPTNDSTTTTNVGMTAPKLDVVTRTVYNYMYSSAPSRQWYVQTPIGFGTVAAAEIITTRGQAKIADTTA